MRNKSVGEGPLTMPSPGLNLWFYEVEGQEMDAIAGVMVKEVLTQRRSEFQELMVLNSKTYGRMLILDGITQLTDFDESGYHEMIVHTPLLCHPAPKRVLVIGGGDGGTVTQVVRHPEVESVVLCEIDPAVVEVCREYFPRLTKGFDDPRVTIAYEDGAKYIADRPGSFDVVIVDSSDPIGPARVLFQEPFYRTLSAALADGGIAVTQAESFFFHAHLIARLFEFVQNIFPRASYYYTNVPTYPSGVIGFAFCSKGPHPTADLNQERAARLKDLQYYTPAVHRGAFALPPRIGRLLPEKVRQFQESL